MKGDSMEEATELHPKVGEILPGQGWVTLHGDFTVKELSDIIIKITANYKEPDKGE